ncbi:WYL domain-containing protein [Niveibacterium sp. 24ML]|uniref:helix-turn-helix transcriptional regulator n=1 Tax=Niveibacterium sp. 24ML TaxID=2985512 RepID=UPI00226F3521|nr:WYL domain-containing protein [Niveibacterium sp. 24ML]MCX9157823.1 WYL domain-containing protein [Niveibacterium sp. 24ML]
MPAASSSKVILDLFRLAQLIPVGRNASVTSLVTALGGNRADPAVIRKVQRQLERLQKMYPNELISDGAKPQGWHWKAGSPIGLNFLTSDMAIALSLVMRYMQQFLPASTLEALEPLLKKSAQVLDQVNRTWSSKILIKRPGPARNQPSVDMNVQRAVYDALRSGNEVLEISYKSRMDPESERRRIWPQGLMMKNDLLYLVASKIPGNPNESASPRWYAMHRIESAIRVAPNASEICPDLSLADKDAEGWFNNGGTESNAKVIELVLRVDEVAAVNLIESPLRDMVGSSELLGNGWVRIRAKVQKTTDLVTWLRAYGPRAVVEAPQDLREEMRAEAQAILKAYTDSVSR